MSHASLRFTWDTTQADSRSRSRSRSPKATSTNNSDIYGLVSNGRLRYSTLEAAVGEAGYMTGMERNSVSLAFGRVDTKFQSLSSLLITFSAFFV